MGFDVCVNIWEEEGFYVDVWFLSLMGFVFVIGDDVVVVNVGFVVEVIV